MATRGPNPETVEALLDTTWRVAGNETTRTDAIDRKASTVATFADSARADRPGERGENPSWWIVALFASTLLVLLVSVVVGVAALFPREYLTLGLAYLRQFPTWRETMKRPETVRGETMRGVIEALARERRANDRKVRLVKSAYTLLIAALFLVAVQAVTLAVEDVR